jgi:adenosylhomocysteinase
MTMLRVLRNPYSYAVWKLKSITKGSRLGRVWVEDHSPMLVNLRAELNAKRPFEGLRLGVCLPGTWESFMFLSALEAGGASLLYYPMFCSAEVGLELLKQDSVRLFDAKSAGKIVKDSDFIHDSTAFLGRIVVRQQTGTKGIVEQTASGTSVYREFEAKGLLRQPVFDLNASYVKRVGENKMATGLGLVEALLRLHIFLPSKRVLVLGYGSVGEGCASYLKGLGCMVSVYDIDLERMGEAENMGLEVGDLGQLLPEADVVVNATGSFSPVLGDKELETLKSGAILVNMGGTGWDRQFFDGKLKVEAGDWITKVFLGESMYVYEVARGLPVNFLFASGTDAETMDVVFSLSVLALEYLVRNYGSLPKTLQPIPEEIQRKHLEMVEKLSKRTDMIAKRKGLR